MTQVLIADDDVAICKTLEMHYSRSGYDVLLAHNAEDGYREAIEHDVDLVITDVRMPGQDGFSLLKRMRDKAPSIPIIMITAFHDLDTTVQAMQGGAADYIMKPLDIQELDAAVDRALHQKNELSAVLPNTSGLGAQQLLVGQSKMMKNVFKQIALVAQNPVTVLIQGESGTGKELIARAIHQASPNADKPFIAVNCGALVESLLESEMFGHEKGAFTGAVSANPGKIEAVGEGTLFLDEITELSPGMQSLFLRVLESREYIPVGGTKVKTSNARFIAASNVNLADAVEAKTFREDLFYRLNVVNIPLPPLRVRREDIPVLVNHLITRINRDLRRNFQGVTAEAMDSLLSYDWPGNVRELDNVLMKAAVMGTGHMLTCSDFPDELCCCSTKGRDENPFSLANVLGGASSSVEDFPPLKDVAQQYVLRVLDETGWHKGEACRILGISRPKLDRHIKDAESDKNLLN